MNRSAGRVGALILVWLACTSAAQAHIGPPFPIVQDQVAGPYKISVWTHPDIGLSAFYVILDPAPGATTPDKNDVEVYVQPVDGRLPEVGYPAAREANRGKVQYDAQVEFDQRDMWRVRVTVAGANGKGEVEAQVESTPTFAFWDLLFYGFPFILFGGLWLVVALGRARRQRREAGSPAAPRRSRGPPAQKR